MWPLEPWSPGKFSPGALEPVSPCRRGWPVWRWMVDVNVDVDVDSSRSAVAGSYELATKAVWYSVGAAALGK